MRRWMIRAAVGLALLAAAGAGLAHGPYTSPLVVPAAAFGHSGWQPESYYFASTGSVRGINAHAHLQAPVYLPNGATITGFSAWVYDNYTSGPVCGGGDPNAPDSNVWLRLERTTISTGTTVDVGNLITSGGSGSTPLLPGTLNPAYVVVNNDLYHYYVDLQFCDDNHHVQAVVIDY